MKVIHHVTGSNQAVYVASDTDIIEIHDLGVGRGVMDQQVYGPGVRVDGDLRSDDVRTVLGVGPMRNLRRKYTLPGRSSSTSTRWPRTIAAGADPPARCRSDRRH